MTHKLYQRFCPIPISIEIDAELPETEEDCRLWVFYLHGEELSYETCLKIVRDNAARKSFQMMLTPYDDALY